MQVWNHLIEVSLGQAPAGPSTTVQLVNWAFVALMVFVFYFLLIRPANKQRKEHDLLLNALKKGDEVVTNGGLWARVVSIDESVATVELADKIKVRILKDRIAGKWAVTSPAKK
jgi:preprotein translocase subunit YajC